MHFADRPFHDHLAGALMSVPAALPSDPVRSLPYDAEILSKIGLASILPRAAFLLIVPLLRKWMGEVK